MNVGSIVLFDYYGGFPQPVVIMTTHTSWNSHAPCTQPAVGNVHLVTCEPGMGFYYDVPLTELSALPAP